MDSDSSTLRKKRVLGEEVLGKTCTEREVRFIAYARNSRETEEANREIQTPPSIKQLRAASYDGNPRRRQRT